MGKKGKSAKPRVAGYEALMMEGQDLLAREQYEEGLAKMRQAYQMASTNAEVVDTFGSALAETGQAEEAIQVLQHAVQLSPSAGFEKYMYLGQLMEGPPAIASVRAGIKILQVEVQGDEGLKAPLTSALCSLVELLLNSAPVEQVDKECEALLTEAMRIDPASVEPMQGLASLRNEQGRADEALKAIRASVKRWLPPPSASGEEAPLPEGAPSFEFRFEAAKLLLDLDSSTDTALRILSGLLLESDTVVDVWYLLSLAHHGACQFDDALECIERGVQLIHASCAEDPAAGEQKLAEFAEVKAAVEESAKAMGQDLMEGVDDDKDDDMADA